MQHVNFVLLHEKSSSLSVDDNVVYISFKFDIQGLGFGLYCLGLKV